MVASTALTQHKVVMQSESKFRDRFGHGHVFPANSTAIIVAVELVGVSSNGCIIEAYDPAAVPMFMVSFYSKSGVRIIITDGCRWWWKNIRTFSDLISGAPHKIVPESTYLAISLDMPIPTLAAVRQAISEAMNE